MLGLQWQERIGSSSVRDFRAFLVVIGILAFPGVWEPGREHTECVV